jgi:prolyl-tRNA synthetase
MTEETFNIDKKSEFSKWYDKILEDAELIDIRYNVKGFVVYKPWAMIAIREISRLFENALEEKGHKPVLFPTVIPEKNLKKEKEHVKGFEPEVFWVTHGGKEKLKEKLALRPTSETAIYPMFHFWIQGYSDLPLKIYQNCSVFRFDTKATKPLIRAREFHWIEAHDAFATEEEARKQVEEDMSITKKVLYDQLGIPFLFFERPPWDKFKGAVSTFASDALMPDGKVIQLPSTHFLGQNFAKAFNIKYLTKEGNYKYVYQTCYGPAYSRIFAALFSIHGDNNGLILPFNIAPIQVIIIPIYYNKNEMEIVLKKCEEIRKILVNNKIRAEVDLTEKTPGAKYYFWEMKGVPIRIEIGKKEVDEKFCTLFRRDMRKKEKVMDRQLVDSIYLIANDILENLRNRAEKFLQENIREAKNFDELKKIINEKGGFVKIPFCMQEKCANEIKEKCNAEVRGTIFGAIEEVNAKCIVCGKKAKKIVYVAKAY